MWRDWCDSMEGSWNEVHQTLWCDLCRTFKKSWARSQAEHHIQMGTRQEGRLSILALNSLHLGEIFDLILNSALQLWLFPSIYYNLFLYSIHYNALCINLGQGWLQHAQLKAWADIICRNDGGIGECCSHLVCPTDCDSVNSMKPSIFIVIGHTVNILLPIDRYSSLENWLSKLAFLLLVSGTSGLRRMLSMVSGSLG